MSNQLLAIANRGEIAIRIARTAVELGWTPVALLGEPDIDSLAAREIGLVSEVGPAGSELNPELVVAAAQRAGAKALHPGYGFLSERADLAQACAAAGIVFVGPTPATLAICGDKVATREAAKRANAPILPASEPLTLDDEGAWRAAAEAVGFPLMAKVVSGGGGRGLRVIHTAEDLDSEMRSALREAGASAAGTTLYLERYLSNARHVEVQVAGDGTNAVALGDRDCSIQRRHQKVVEEAPAFGLSDELRASIHAHAVNISRAVGLSNIATVEFLLGADGNFYFMEVNPRLQVEHTVTEEVTGLDLVAVQLSLAYGGELPLGTDPVGHAMQARLYAEDPANNFVPSPGEIRFLEYPDLPDLRVDNGYESGDVVSGHYDALLAKLITHAPTRNGALDLLRDTCCQLLVGGIATNRPWLMQLLSDKSFIKAEQSLATAETVSVPTQPAPSTIAKVAETDLAPAWGVSAWESAGPFRIVAPASIAFHDPDGGWQVDVAFERIESEWRAVVDGAIPDAECPVLVIGNDDETREVSDASGRWLFAAGHRPHAGSGSSQHDGNLRAPMPGTIAAINVSVGDDVANGDVLAVMTAMKMELAIAAPFAGTVAEVRCTVGDLVSSRQLLLVIVPREAASE